MPDLFDLLARWWKQILLLVIAAVAAAGIILFFIPNEYLGVATALPAPTYASDKSTVFAQNLQELYSAFGTPDDLDKIVGTAHLDTVYVDAANRLDLAKHYAIVNDDSQSVRKAGCLLKKRTRVIKTDYGELQVKVWDKDKRLAALLANTIMEKLQQIHQDIQTANNELILSRVDDEYARTKTEYQRVSDSVGRSKPGTDGDRLTAAHANSLLQQLQEYEKLSAQYKLMVDARPAALIIVERAVPALKADRPKRLEVIILAGTLAFFFALLAALVLEGRRVRAK